jgi:hypothetical protein
VTVRAIEYYGERGNGEKPAGVKRFLERTCLFVKPKSFCRPATLALPRFVRSYAKHMVISLFPMPVAKELLTKKESR